MTLKLIIECLLWWTVCSFPFGLVARWWITKQPNDNFFDTMTRKQRWLIGTLLILGLPYILVDTSICRLLRWAAGRKI